MEQAKVFAVMLALAAVILAFGWIFNAWPTATFYAIMALLMLKLLHLVATLLIEIWKRKA